MKSIWPRKKSHCRIGIEVSAEAIGFSVINMANAEQAHVEVCERYSIGPDMPEGLSVVAERLRQLGLVQAPCYGVLSQGDYELLLIEAPNVPADELKDAAYWRLKDLITFPINEAATDIFQLPDAEKNNGKSMLYAVVVRKTIIQTLIDTVAQLNLTLCSIDIPELCCRNLLEYLPANDKGIALLRLQQGQGNLFLVKNTHLYLSRYFPLNYHGGVEDALPEDKLILELQRSFDYYERQMGQLPPIEIVFNGENVIAEKITTTISSSFPAACTTFPWEDVMSVSDKVDYNLLASSMPTIGAAMRKGNI